MPAAIRLTATQTADPQTVRLILAFAAPSEDEQPAAVEAWLETGEGAASNLGQMYAPGPATWHTARQLDLVSQTYTGEGPYTARLLWGETLAQTTVTPGLGRPAPDDATAAQLTAFHVEDVEGRPQERIVRWAVRGLGDGEALRVDAGAAQISSPAAEGAGGGAADERRGECRLTFAKPGHYLVALDVLDAQGFWLASLAEYPVEVSTLPEGTPTPQPLAEETPVRTFGPVADRAPDADAGGLGPWQAGFYARPAWGWLRTYSSPGGSDVVRVLPPGSYLSLRGETLIGSALWYQTAGQDWIAADVLDPVLTGDLRGVAFESCSPAPDEPGGQAGLVTARVLNVRPQPGVQAGNVPYEQLAGGAEVTVYEETRYGGVTWYRIGTDRWVHGDHLRLLPAAQYVQLPSRPSALPLGWVVAPALNVRPRPGLAGDNAPIDQVEHNQALPIFDTRSLGGTPWHCIGENRWVEGAWIAVARPVRRPAAPSAAGHWVAVGLNDQTLVAYEGDRPVYAAMVATGRSVTPTPLGLFPVRERSERALMAGGNPGRGSSYFLEDVPWVQYFYGGYALQGAYWHDSFGRPRSHGCVNLSLYDAWWLYRWQVEHVLIH
ncbi:MAG TPA: L,D-transpeptidase [Anaerolineae bacterium]